ncbi:low molecular weight phosphotyrosine protein phosphatase [Salmonella enterica subsp. enterica serovar Enteritidis]|nr:low molecular weight phosphotyrosine protein phosphatase [Salmonella enterica subsp. enterica serovar Enteritidis]
MTENVTRLLFVCLGNICRSPLAKGVFADVAAGRRLAGRYRLDSAGTGGWHAGSAPDPRSIAVAAAHGVDISGQQARKVRPSDFAEFDLILGMDRSNVEDLKRLAGPARDKVHLFIDYATGSARDVPDPYYGGPEGFEQVYRMIRDASEALVDRLGARASAVSGQASSMM